jgi:lipopolysaccharide transport system permease protein
MDRGPSSIVHRPSSIVHRPLMKLTVYTPDSQLRHPLRMVRAMLADLWLARELGWRLTVRDISAQYRQAFLGVLWALILPLVNTVTWIFLNGSGIVAVADTALPYPVYVFTGTMLWQIFTEAFQAPNVQVNQGKAMLSKVNFPHEALILSGLGQTGFNALIKIGLLIPAVLILGIIPDWTILLLPLGILSLMLAGTALGLLLTPIGALYADVAKGIGLVTQFWMYITPVVFALPESGLTATIFRLNPLTPLILTSRDWLTGFRPEFLLDFVLVNLVMGVVLIIGWVIYRVSMPILIERMNA